jgi:hypothetical protein
MGTNKGRAFWSSSRTSRSRDGQAVRTHESDLQLEIEHSQPDESGWTRSLKATVWNDEDGAGFLVATDFLNVFCTAANFDDDDVRQDAGINLNREETIALRDFLTRVLDPEGVERKFDELREQLKEQGC